MYFTTFIVHSTQRQKRVALPKKIEAGQSWKAFIHLLLLSTSLQFDIPKTQITPPLPSPAAEKKAAKPDASFHKQVSSHPSIHPSGLRNEIRCSQPA